MNVAMLYNLEIGSVYNIPMLAPAILSVALKNATVLGLLDYASAIQIEDVSAIHQTVLSLLPVGTPADPSKLIYVKIKTSTGTITVIAMNWISVQPTLVSATSIVVTLTNVNLSDISTISAILNANGFRSFTIAGA